MACPSAFVNLQRHTEYFVEQLRMQASPQAIFYNLIQRGAFPEGQGTVLTTFTIGRSLPTSDLPDFEPITTDQMANNCEIDYTEVKTGYSTLNYRPEKFGWKGEPVCADNLIYDWQVERFMDAYLRTMRKNVIWTVENRLTAIYDHYVPKAVAASYIEWTGPGTGFPGQTPSFAGLGHTECQLTQEMLEQVAVTLNEEGAMEGPYDDGWINLGNDGPIYTLLIGQAESQNLLRRNAELRSDFRFGEMGEGQNGATLLKRIGATRVIGNFRHAVTAFPSRYNWNGSTYVRVNTWVDDPEVTRGEAVKINPEWLSADFEAVRVLSPNVFRSQILRPVTAAGGGTMWPPRSYAGVWNFITGGYRTEVDGCYDPQEKIGRHFAEYQHAPEPILPKYGRTIIVRRCQASATCIQCEPVS